MRLKIRACSALLGALLCLSPVYSWAQFDPFGFQEIILKIQQDQQRIAEDARRQMEEAQRKAEEDRKKAQPNQPAAPQKTELDDFYWSASYGRGAGTVPPLVCPAGQDLDAGLCYSKCPDGFHGVGPVCWNNSETSYTVKTQLPIYDYWFKTRCPGSADLEGKLCYDHCKGGYHRILSTCWINSMSVGRGVGTAAPLVCPQSFDQNQGLCYTKCGDGFNGVGPVCWAKGPPGYVACGAGYAKDETACGQVILSQTTSAVTLTLSACGAGVPICSGAVAAYNTATKWAFAKKAVAEVAKNTPGKSELQLAEAMLKDSATMMIEAEKPMAVTMQYLSKVSSGAMEAGEAMSKCATATNKYISDAKQAYPLIFALQAAMRGSGVQLNPTNAADQVRAFADLTAVILLLQQAYNPELANNPPFQLLAAGVDAVSAYSWPIYGAD